ncbi:hypothetical protein RJ639_014527 [Escallonia herrerae]|uniref:Retrotransposon gag domain-containing protein n=1 Tax=Escallonia herrerae TaxID=1293975 RepID=A0AA88VIP6_9ASTE|nr:hypothetical protein RJ639_014527 [Escallonia herrerae]
MASISAPETVVPLAMTITPPSESTVLPPFQTFRTSEPLTTGVIHTTPPVMNNEAYLMAVLRAVQQSIKQLQAVVKKPPPQSEPRVSNTPEWINQHVMHGEDGQSNDERRNPRSRRQEESSYEAHSTQDTYYYPGEHRAERYTSAPVIIGRPFTKEVDCFPAPPSFKMPPCESYDGTGDPMEHLARFTSGMNLHLVLDQIMCRAFPITLKGVAHVWFQHLAPRSISCWAQLAKSFCSNFLTSRIQRKNSSALFHIVQALRIYSSKKPSLKCISRDRIQPVSYPIYGFTGASAPVEGVIPLTLVAGKHPLQATQLIDFLVVKVKSPYNGILGRAGLNKLQAVALTFHLCMKFPTSNGIGVVNGDQAVARKCYMASCKVEEALAIED